MIPARMSREELEKFVLRACTQCIKDCPPFKAGEFYPVDQDDVGITVWVDAEFSDAVDFTYEEAKEYFENHEVE